MNIIIADNFAFRRFRIGLIAMAAVVGLPTVGQAQQFWNTNGSSGLLTASNWGTTDAGPFTNAYSANTEIVFSANSLITNVTNTNIGNITVNGAFNVLWTAAGTMPTNGAVRTFDVASGGVLDLAGQAISTSPGTGFIKNGAGILFMSNGNAYTGGFTLNAGTMIVGGVNAMGAGGTLTINGGTIAANTTRDLTGKYAGGITVGGDFTLGGTTTGVVSGNAVATANLTFSNNMDFGAATRAITLGGTGIYTFGGIISGATGTGLTVNSITTGILALTGLNTYDGVTTLNGGSVSVTTFANVNVNSGIGKGSAGGSADDLIFGGGTLTHSAANVAITDRLFTLGNANGLTATINSSAIAVTDTLSFTGTGTIAFGGSGARTLTLTGTNTGNNTFSPALGDGSGGSTALVKSLAGAWVLTGANTYTGSTNINAGRLQFAKLVSLYNNTPSSWNPGNIGVASGATLALNVGGAGEFTTTDLATFLDSTHMGLSTTTTGFKTGSILGLDTTNAGGSFTPTVAFTDPGTSLNLGLAKLGTGTLVLNLANTFTGPLIVSGGVLILNQAGRQLRGLDRHGSTDELEWRQQRPDVRGDL